MDMLSRRGQMHYLCAGRVILVSARSIPHLQFADLAILQSILSYFLRHNLHHPAHRYHLHHIILDY